MKNIFKIVFTYGLIFILFTIFYLVLFHTPLFSFQKVLFYRGVILLMVGTFFSLILSLFVFKKIKISYETLFTAIVVAASINLSLFVVLPVTIERSVTMYLLNTLKDNNQRQCGGLTKKELEEKLINEYIIKRKAIDKRVNEQSIIDFVDEKNSCINITLKADNFLKLSKIIGAIYNLK